ncbi:MULTISPECIES: hypothetical protein [unclassified Bradyrhizobium]|uniref:hypothetical protein n=1 Tax=unclassified Bradyrhizobium TaxID=2631580 RepID=UPI002303247A|nr:MULTISPECIES: hypothetical protein [unclassified Bradyrhizobium]MDA9400979.1 hypothetical protein [Bradyrhizobium sp. CCBAU 45389]MDA9527371.1 hypothetical protein [Bradyrhizobium sp. CCBAU 25338]
MKFAPVPIIVAFALSGASTIKATSIRMNRISLIGTPVRRHRFLRNWLILTQQSLCRFKEYLGG